MNQKKTIIILIFILLVGIVGLTIAYFTNTTSINNLFSTNPYGTTIEEVFESPDNWLPGTTTEKEITVTNSGSVDEAVRISYSETWKTKDNTILSGLIDQDGNLTSTEENSEHASIINFSDNDDWTYSNGYYYYNYRLAPKETTSSLIKSVTFNSKTKLDDTCTTTINGSTKTITCNSSGSDYDDATYTLTFTVETVQYNKYQEAWNTNVAIASEKPSSGVDTLLSNAINADGAAYNTTTKSKMFKMTHPATSQTPAQTEYRYIGDNPNNYVYFNCDSLDNQNSSSCEVWRIIGVFDVDDGTGNYEQRIKLVRGSALPNEKKWDNRDAEGYYAGNGYGKNEWEGSLIQTYLNDNGDYYQRTGTAANYGLKATAKSLISNAKYYLGGMHFDNTNGYGTADAIYLWERGNETFSYETYCIYQNSNDTKCTIENYCGNNSNDELCTATRNTSWVGEVGLMYPSDQYLVYSNEVDNVCYNNPYNCSENETWGEPKTTNIGYPQLGWIYNSNKLEGQNSITYNWFVSPFSSNSAFVFLGRSVGFLNYYDYGDSTFGTRPVLYLSSNVKITDGTGESTNPYKLGL